MNISFYNAGKSGTTSYDIINVLVHPKYIQCCGKLVLIHNTSSHLVGRIERLTLLCPLGGRAYITTARTGSVF
jgi:hypothetical protein